MNNTRIWIIVNGVYDDDGYYPGDPLLDATGRTIWFDDGDAAGDVAKRLSARSREAFRRTAGDWGSKRFYGDSPITYQAMEVGRLAEDPSGDEIVDEITGINADRWPYGMDIDAHEHVLIEEARRRFLDSPEHDAIIKQFRDYCAPSVKALRVDYPDIKDDDFTVMFPNDHDVTIEYDPLRSGYSICVATVANPAGGSPAITDTRSTDPMDYVDEADMCAEGRHDWTDDDSPSAYADWRARRAARTLGVTIGETIPISAGAGFHMAGTVYVDDGGAIKFDAFDDEEAGGWEAGVMFSDGDRWCVVFHDFAAAPGTGGTADEAIAAFLLRNGDSKALGPARDSHRCDS
jgi:hypothetical protein